MGNKKLKAQKVNDHSLKIYSGHHILSYHSTQNTPRAYVGKPTCLFTQFPDIEGKCPITRSLTTLWLYILLNYNYPFRNMKSMTAVDGLAKGSEAVTYIASAVTTFVNSGGDAKQIASGVLDLVNALAVFLPPPASSITSMISSIANMFLGGGTPDTASLIEEEFAKQSEMILDQFEKMKQYIEEALDQQTLEEMKIIAQVTFTCLLYKNVFD